MIFKALFKAASSGSLLVTDRNCQRRPQTSSLFVSTQQTDILGHRLNELQWCLYRWRGRQRQLRGLHRLILAHRVRQQIPCVRNAVAATSATHKWHFGNTHSAISKQIHLVGERFMLKIHPNTAKLFLRCWRFSVYQRSSSEEEADTSSSSSWHDKNLTCQESSRICDSAVNSVTCTTAFFFLWWSSLIETEMSTM